MRDYLQECDDHAIALHVLHLHDYFVQHPDVYRPKPLDDGVFYPAKSRRGVTAPPDELYAPALSTPADEFIFHVLIAGSSEWVCGDRYTRVKARHLCIELVTQGMGELRVGQHKRFTLRPGDVFVLHPDERHTYRACSRTPFKKLYVALSASTPAQRAVLAATPLWHLSHLRLPPDDFRRVRELLEHIIALLREAGADAPMRCSIAAYELLVTLTRVARQQPGRQALDPRLQAVMAFVVEHISEPLGIHDLARVAGVSRDHLTRLFVKELGMRAHEWLVKLRMRFAAELLRKTHAPIYVIAAQAGYDNPYAFSRAFKQVAGMNPVTYRARGWKPR